MSQDVNFAVISGRLARNPDVRQSPSGISICDITVANNRGRGDKEKTVYLRCTTWNATAEFCSKLGVGDFVTVQGTISDDNYLPKDSDIRTKGRIRLDNCQVTLLKKKNQVNQIVTEESSPSEE
jgi:single-strand DNA-binding protein